MVRFSWFPSSDYQHANLPAALSVETALDIVDGWQNRKMVVAILPGEQHWKIVSTLLRESGTAGNLTADAHLAALCIERGATLHSADSDFGGFRGLRWVNPRCEQGF